MSSLASTQLTEFIVAVNEHRADPESPLSGVLDVPIMMFDRVDDVAPHNFTPLDINKHKLGVLHVLCNPVYCIRLSTG